MNAPRRLQSSPSLVPYLEKADHANDVDIPKMTGRELAVLGLIAEGLCSQAVADRLFVSKRTVDFHLQNIYRKLRITRRTQAVQFAYSHGLLKRPAVTAADFTCSERRQSSALRRASSARATP